MLFFQEAHDQGEESDEEGDGNGDEDELGSADGFVPVTELQFVLPDEMVQQQSVAQQPGYRSQDRSHQAPTGQQQHGGPAAQHQGTHQTSGTRSPRPPESGGR